MLMRIPDEKKLPHVPVVTPLSGQPERRLASAAALIERTEREERQRHLGMVLWLTGYSGAGKTTMAHLMERRLFDQGCSVTVLDGDVMRMGLNRDLDFSDAGRSENIRRVAETAKLMVNSGMVCLCAFISPTEAQRQAARKIIGPDDFREVFVNCSLETCVERDVKGFYRKALAGKIANYTGISSNYEPPVAPDYVIETEEYTTEFCADALSRYILGEIALRR